ncbi:hypothetical protein B0T24DRAFT_534336 [Lasiosphaeria ovina]|uniref:Uncharacterized protein n=1 Tax=Lasiosphaeria ovina TaxID=92902 RepID=A0AAE0K0N1_9PEZI|nr:hypothetical protein B0T24DRAFT_534336 [Lasiosphaeria ovina]
MALPLQILLRRFGQFIPPPLQDLKSRPFHPDDTILSSNMSCQAMVRVANIKIAWVDAFPLHLEFDERTATLKLFRFPSFCAMLAIPRNSERTLFDRLFRDAAGSDADSVFETEVARSPMNQDLFVELLCTYRLIFGQHDKAVSQYQKMKPPSSSTTQHSDPLLDDLCGTQSKKCGLFQTIDACPEKLIYSAESDFPAFGARLLVLQKFVIAQSPNTIKALWLDRRDTHRFWTFWAVLIFGGFSLVLFVIQVFIGGFQINLAIQQMASSSA